MVGRPPRNVNGRTELVDSSASSTPKLRVGPAGWSYADWKGRVYPPSVHDELAWIARFFDLVEINVSFYRIPPARTSASWVERVAHRPEFEFSAKLPRSMTHGEREVDPAVRARFLEFLRPLVDAGRLGPLLAQFPWSFRPDDAALAHLVRLREAFGELPVVFELRHGAWGRDPWPRRLREHALDRVSVDQPAVGDALALDAEPGRVGYLRLHGRNRETWFAKDAGRDARYDYFYAPQELESIARVARTLRDRGSTYVVTNNHFRGQAVWNALEIRELLGLGAPEIPAELWREWPRAAAEAEARGWRPRRVGGPEEGPPHQGELFA